MARRGGGPGDPDGVRRTRPERGAVEPAVGLDLAEPRLGQQRPPPIRLEPGKRHRRLNLPGADRQPKRAALLVPHGVLAEHRFDATAELVIVNVAAECVHVPGEPVRGAERLELRSEQMVRPETKAVPLPFVRQDLRRPLRFGIEARGTRRENRPGRARHELPCRVALVL